MSKIDKSGQEETRFIQPVTWITYPPEDEISLGDLWRALSRRRWWVVSTFVIFVAAGIAYALLIPPSYEYTTVIDIGTRIDSGGNTRSLTAPDALAALATNTFIPTVLHNYAEQHASDDLYKIKATHPQSSNLVVLSAKGPLSKQAAFKTLEQRLAQKLFDIPAHLAQTLHQQLSQQVQAVQTRIISLQDILDQLRASIAAQPRSDTLHMQRSQAKIDLAQVQSELAQKQGQLAALAPPQLSTIAMQSQGPVGLSSKLIVVVAAILGLLIGIILALFADFVGRVSSA